MKFLYGAGVVAAMLGVVFMRATAATLFDTCQTVINGVIIYQRCLPPQGGYIPPLSGSRSSPPIPPQPTREQMRAMGAIERYNSSGGFIGFVTNGDLERMARAAAEAMERRYSRQSSGPRAVPIVPANTQPAPSMGGGGSFQTNSVMNSVVSLCDGLQWQVCSSQTYRRLGCYWDDNFGCSR